LAVFALTTVISWAHFSERCFAYLGGKNLFGFRVLFCGVTFCGPFFPVALVWSMADTVVGLLLLVHLIPLTFILLRRGPRMVRALERVSSKAEASPPSDDNPKPEAAWG
jgi:AGCS family alanine or glycine:cation symporter